MKKITGEQIFQILSDRFAIGPSASGYTLNYSVSGKPGTWTAHSEETEAGVTEPVEGVAGMYYKLAGNTGDVEILTRN